jgi:hypothetical protein
LLKDVIDLSSIDLQFTQRVAIIVALSWGPIQAMKIVRKKIDPTENEKIMKNMK